MRNLSTRLSQSLLLTLVFIVYAPGYTFGQTLFDYAVELDSLYDQLQARNASAAKPFFDVARKAAKLDPNYPIEELKRELAKVELGDEADLALQLHSLSKGMEKDSLSIFKVQHDSLASLIMELTGYSKEEARKVYYTGGETNDVIEEALRTMDTPLPDTTRKQITLLMIDAKFIQNKIKILRGRKSNGPSLSQSEEALDMFPLAAETTGSATAPIIIQNQGGGSAQSAIIDGASKWIAERMRQELSIAFFDRFETWAEAKNISLLFPNTISVLKSSATTDYTLMMEIYKRAFEKDLHQLTFNMPAFLENEIIDEAGNQQLLIEIAHVDQMIKKQDFENGVIHDYDLWRRASSTEELIEQRSAGLAQLRRQQAIKYLNFSLRAVNHLQEGQHPSILLNTLYNQSDDLFPQNANLKSILLLLNVISQSLTATNAEQNTVWIGKEAMNRLRTDRQLRTFYFGLLALQLETFMNTQVLRQEKAIQKAIPTETRNRRNELMKYDSTLLSNFITDVKRRMQSPVFGYAPHYPENFILSGNDPASMDLVVQAYYQKNFPEDTMPQMKDKFRTALEILLYSKYNRFLFDIRQATEENDRLALEASEFLKDPRSEEDEFIIKGLYTRLSEGFRERFVRYAFVNADFETAKEDFLKDINYYSTIDTLFKPEFDNEKYRAIVDSIHTLCYRQYFDFVKKYIEGENDSEELYNEFYHSLKTNIIEREGAQFVIQQNLQDLSYLTADLQLSQLEQQKSFLRDFILGNQSDFGQLFSRFVQYANKIDVINAQFKELRSSGQANFGNQEFIYLIKNSMGILDLVFDYAIDKNNPAMVRNMETIQFATNNLLDAYIAGLSEDYNGVVMNIIPVVEKLVADKYDKLISPLENELRSSLSEEQLSMGLLPRSVALDSLRLLRDDKLRKMQEVFKYCTFIAAVAKSQDSEDVKKAINAIALPIGSYSIKRRTYANISLNAYPGITGGAELIQKNDFSEWAPNFGFTAPIGVGINWGYRRKINENRYRNNLNYRNRVQKAEIGADDRIFNGHSGSFFFSIVDLGAIVLFRLSDTEEPLPEEVGFKQILSPGFAYVHGLPRVPISIMLGAQMTPGLRKIGEGENLESANSFRFNLSLVVDLPVTNFYTRQGPKR